MTIVDDARSVLDSSGFPAGFPEAPVDTQAHTHKHTSILVSISSVFRLSSAVSLCYVLCDHLLHSHVSRSAHPLPRFSVLTCDMCTRASTSASEGWWGCMLCIGANRKVLTEPYSRPPKSGTSFLEALWDVQLQRRLRGLVGEVYQTALIQSFGSTSCPIIAGHEGVWLETYIWFGCSILFARGCKGWAPSCTDQTVVGGSQCVCTRVVNLLPSMPLIVYHL